MPIKLTTTVSKIAQVPNKTNFAIIEEFYAYMRAKGSSEQHQNNALKTVIAYANFLGSETTFREVQQKTAAVTIILAIDTAAITLVLLLLLLSFFLVVVIIHFVIWIH